MNTLLNRTRVAMMAFLAIFAFAACDSSTSALQDDASDTDEVILFTSAIAADLGLDAQQTASMDGVAARFGDGEMRAPGFLWQLALQLSQDLTPDQITEMIEKAASARERLGADFQDGRPEGGPGIGGPGGAGRGFEGQGGPGQGGPRFEDLLTDEQLAAVEAIRETYGTQIRELMDAMRDATDDAAREAIRAELDALHEAIKADVDALLTDDQRAQIEANREAAQQAREDARAEERAVMAEVLGVTVADIEVILDALHTNLDALRQAVEDGGMTPEDAREAAQALHEDARSAFQDLLGDNFVIFEIHDALTVRARVHQATQGGRQQGQGGRPGPGGQGGPGGMGGPGGQGGPGGPGGMGGPGTNG